MRTPAVLLLTLAVLLSAYYAPAQEVRPPPGYPAKPISVIIPFAAGGGMDRSMRLLAKYAEVELGEKIEFLNITRGGNIQGNLEAIRAAPDGYVLGCWGMGLVTDELVVKNAPYTHKDVLPVCMYARDPHIITISAKFAARTDVSSLEELVAHMRENPGKVMFGSGGNWTSHDFIRLRIEKLAGVKFARIPFLGGALALQAAIDGNCDVVTPFPSEYQPHSGSEAIIPLAITSTRRLSLLPDVPTVEELELPELEQSMWRVLTVPKGANPGLVRYLAAVFGNAVKNPRFVLEAEAMGVIPEFMSGKELEEFIEKEYQYFLVRTEEEGVRVNAD